MVECLQMIELGYCGQVIFNKLFIDVNVYYNIFEDFLSLVIVVGVIMACGDQFIEDVQFGFGVYGGLVVIYINFGLVNIYGVDFLVIYYFMLEFSMIVNYFYFDWSVDEDNVENDFNGDGVVNFLDILVNVLMNKGGIGLDYFDEKFFVGFYVCWVEEFDYFFSFQIVFRFYFDFIYCGCFIIEDVCSVDIYNYGLFGGFVIFDLNFGYCFNDCY